MVHRQADYAVSHFVRLWQVLGLRTLKSAVGRKLADERIEVAAAEYVLLFHLEVKLVAGHTVFLRVNEDREV